MYDVQWAFFPLPLEYVPSPALRFVYSQAQDNYQYPPFFGFPNLEILLNHANKGLVASSRELDGASPWQLE